MSKKYNVLFLGTPEFAIPTLEILSIHPMIQLCGVITMPDRPVGRGLELKAPPVAQFAKDKKIPLFQTENINKDPELLEKIQLLNLDFILVLAFAQFLSSKVLIIPKQGCFNIHTSILPKYRGAAPIQYALLNGDDSTGVSIQKMVKEMDAGDLVHFHQLEIASYENAELLYTRLKFQAALSTHLFIEDMLKNQLVSTPQDRSGISFAPTLKKEDGFIDFKNKTYAQIFNQMRALNPWPSTYCMANNKRLKILEIEKINKTISPGSTDISQGIILIGIKDGALRLKKVQLEGKKVCSDSELLNGLINRSLPFSIDQ